MDEQALKQHFRSGLRQRLSALQLNPLWQDPGAESATTDDAVSGLSRLLHQLTGASGTYQFSELYRLSAAAENTLEQSADRGRRPEWQQQLARQLQALEQELNRQIRLLHPGPARSEPGPVGAPL